MARNRGALGGKREMDNAFQTLLANIGFASMDDPVSTIVVTSAIPNEGKTTVSSNLARAIVSSGLTVLLVECDMRKRSIAAELGVHSRSGINSVLSGKASLEDAVVEVEQGFSFLDAEPGAPNPPAIFASKRFRSLVETLARRYDYVIFDTPPVTTFVDAAVISSVASGTILVVRENFAKRQDVRAAYAQLQKAGSNVIGVVMNCCREERNDYYYAYYDADGNRVRKSEGVEERPMPDLPARRSRISHMRVGEGE